MTQARCVFVNMLTALILLAATSSPADAAEKPSQEKLRVSAQVICTDQKLAQRFTSALRKRLQGQGLEVTDELPIAKLLLYVNQDVNDTINPTGYSIAVAHLSNYMTYVVASKLMESSSSDVAEVKPVLVDMLREEGFMTSINVVHIDRMTEQSITEASTSLADAFIGKTRKRWE